MGLVLGADSKELIAGAAVALLAVAVSLHLAAGGRPSLRSLAVPRTVAVAERGRRARLPRLRDPDAAGRARPRAPSARPSAA